MLIKVFKSRMKRKKYKIRRGSLLFNIRVLFLLGTFFLDKTSQVSAMEISKGISIKVRVVKEIRVTNSGDNDSPVWSPTGKYIVFVRYQRYKGAVNWSIWIMETNGNNQKQLTKGPIDGSPVWTPDGEKIVYAQLKSTNRKLYFRIMNIDGLDNHLLIKKGFDSALPLIRFSPDGKQIVVELGNEEKSEIYILNLYTEKFRKLPIPSGYNAMWPSWSPDGKKIVYVVQKKNHNCGKPFNICVTDLSTGQFHQLTHINNSNPYYPEVYYPSWSPDGKWIAFIKYEPGTKTKPERQHIWMMREDGTNEIQITKDDKQKEDGPISWSPDGQKMAFVRNGDIWIATLKFEKSKGDNGRNNNKK